MFVRYFSVLMLGCFGYGRKCWCHVFHWCFGYCIRICCRSMFVGCFDNNHVGGGMEYVLGFVVGCVACYGCGFVCSWFGNFVGVRC